MGNAENWKAISFGAIHSVGLTESGDVYAWGANDFGQLGLNDNAPRSTPTQLSLGGNAVSISTGLYSTFILLGDGSVLAAGRNNNGQLGIGTSTSMENTLQTVSISSVYKIAAGTDHTLFIKNDNTLWGSGSYSYGKITNGTTTGLTTTPLQIGVDTDWENVSCGLFHSLGTKSSNTLFAWGKNNNAQIQTPAQTMSNMASISNNINQATAGAGSTILLKNDGSLYAMGDNRKGQLGTGSNELNQASTQIGADFDWNEVISGPFHTLARKQDDSVYGWGNNNAHQTNGSTMKKVAMPTLVFSAPITAYLNTTGQQVIDTEFNLSVNSVINNSGNTFTYTWNIINAPGGSTASLSGNINASANMVLDLPGTYIVQVNVDDGSDSDNDTITINVADKNRYGTMVWGTDNWNQ